MKFTTALQHSSKHHCRGLGSVELTLMAIVGFFALSSVISSFGENQASKMSETKVRLLAQEMEVIARSAEVAGVDLVAESSLERTVDLIAEGETAKYGAFAGQHYGVGSLSPQAKEKVLKFLEIKGGKLVYSSEKFEWDA